MSGRELKVAIINISLRPGAKVRFFPVGLGFVMTAIRDAGYQFDFIDQDLYNLSQEEVVDELVRGGWLRCSSYGMHRHWIQVCTISNTKDQGEIPRYNRCCREFSSDIDTYRIA